MRRPKGKLWYRFIPRPAKPHHYDLRFQLSEALDPYVLLEQMRAAGCTVFERKVVALFLVHQSRAAVAGKLDLPFGVVALAIESAIEKLKIWRERKRLERAFEGWKGVYIQEVNRWSYTDEQHCKPGEEACAKDGLCKYRWYLTREETL